MITLVPGQVKVHWHQGDDGPAVLLGYLQPQRRRGPLVIREATNWTPGSCCIPRKSTVRADVFSPGRGLWSHPEKSALVSICQHCSQQSRQHLSALLHRVNRCLPERQPSQTRSWLPLTPSSVPACPLYTSTQHTLCSGWPRTLVCIRVQLELARRLADETSGAR